MIEPTDNEALANSSGDSGTAGAISEHPAALAYENSPLAHSWHTGAPGTGGEMRYDGNRQRIAFAIAVAGWLVPGLGHALLKMWGRAAACFLTVGVLVFLGAGMRGNVFTSRGNDAFDTLGYVADLGTGSFYFAARSLEAAGADVSHANGDYGTRFLATAGILNLLAA